SLPLVSCALDVYTYYINNSWLSINNRHKNYFSIQKKISMLMVNLISKSNSYLYFNKSIEKTFLKFKLFCSYYKLPKMLVDIIIDLYFNENINLEKTISELKKFEDNDFKLYELPSTLEENDILKIAKNDFDDLKNYIKINFTKYNKNSIDFLVANKIIFNKKLEINDENKLFKKIDWFSLFWIYENDKEFLLKKIKKHSYEKDTIENRYKNILVKILNLNTLKDNVLDEQEIIKEFEEIFKTLLIKNNDFYFVKNSKNEKNFFSPYLINGTAGLIFLLLEFYKISKNKKEIKSIIEKYLDSIKNFNLMKMSFYNGIAGFLYVLIKYSLVFKTNKFDNLINQMIYSLHISKSIKNNSVCYTDMYYMLKNNFSEKLGILYVINEYLIFKKQSKLT
ncbi:MAG: hypothetical protein K2H56_00470, partial [Malacoplasma sp.]|nr:hypothetical protein [Malacoplasma sp.]